mmetsp:Transcript_21263/g.27436  ORF Transcript_21263/g.27436 Transcript_21263/m.27436 type:complete len:650 (+) Transcript_21263:290-2239(+)
MLSHCRNPSIRHQLGRHSRPSTFIRSNGIGPHTSRSYISLPSSFAELVRDAWEIIRADHVDKRKQLVVLWKKRLKSPMTVRVEEREMIKSRSNISPKVELRSATRNGRKFRIRSLLLDEFRTSREKFKERILMHMFEGCSVSSSSSSGVAMKKNSNLRRLKYMAYYRNYYHLIRQRYRKKLSAVFLRERATRARKLSLAYNKYYQRFRQDYHSKFLSIFSRARRAATNRHLPILKLNFFRIEKGKEEWFDDEGYPKTSRNARGRFVNPWSISSSTPPFLKFLLWRKERLFGLNSPASLRQPNSLEERNLYLPTFNGRSTLHRYMARNSPVHFKWIGHSTCLVEMRSNHDTKDQKSYRILTDPVFSEHAAPIQSGVPRMIPPACSIDNIGQLDAVVISHDHYDHLDVKSLREIEEKNLLGESGKYFVPLGHKRYLHQECGIHEDRIIEMEWWQSDSSLTKSKSKLKVTCAPAQHWCSRTPFDRNVRLWCSWAFQVDANGPSDRILNTIHSPISSFYFAGDTGFPESFPLHEQIGDRLGPFDLCAIPIGAYSPEWFMKESHCNPEDSIKMHKALRSRFSVGIHWGTWALADEPYFEPPLLMKKAAERDGLRMGRDVFVLRHGESVSIPNTTDAMDESTSIVSPHPILHMNN